MLRQDDLDTLAVETGRGEALRLADAWAHSTPQNIVRDALARFARRIALVSSFGADSAVLLHMIAAADRTTPVVFVDTLRLFPETLAHRDALVARLRLIDVRTVRPAAAELARRDPDLSLAERDPDACCGLRKVVPFAQAIEPFAAWFTGRRRDQALSRAALSHAEWDGARIKINPLAGWTIDDAVAYRREHGLPEHPLAAQGYPSIGCVPCTSRVDADEDLRAGRWRGLEKTECGLHDRRTAAPPSSPSPGGGESNAGLLTSSTRT
ncbi:phosphoadenylyl-sulfate reductase [Rhodoplanes roseus]|uniref:Adenosine 5'-phosphosulfate reductase n=1 Tax=Rhodoplanes roseus TaxID=29409 RepID=A0A327LDF3_9BRAD|nr:phosphoadenylyl-sulfate reductase [Rhodoplanes roseus]RAI45838.1 phosphoadenosine phosphosulfate reductase [Rhodoplanes roseus]